MTEWWYRRAEYDKHQQAYVVRYEDRSEVLYRFIILDRGEVELYPELAIVKEWEDDGNGPMSELYSFMFLEEEERFHEIVDDILAGAREAAVAENVDEFLAVIDIIDFV